MNDQQQIYSLGYGVISTVAPLCRARSNSPVAYRLMKKKTGELVLQGAFQWTEGLTKSGIDWEDLLTEVEA